MKRKLTILLLTAALLLSSACSTDNPGTQTSADTAAAQTQAVSGSESAENTQTAESTAAESTAETQAEPVELVPLSERLKEWADITDDVVIARLSNTEDEVLIRAFDLDFRAFRAEYACMLLSQDITDDMSEEQLGEYTVKEYCEQQRSSMLDLLTFEKRALYVADKEYGISEETLTDEELSQADADAASLLESWSGAYYAKASYELGADASDDDIKARSEELLREDFAAAGISTDIFKDWALSDIIQGKLVEKLTESAAVTDEMVEEMFNGVREQAIEAYENDVASYESTSAYNSVYIPEGSRTIRQIMLRFSDEDAQKIAAAADDDAKNSAVESAYSDDIKNTVKEIQQKIAGGAQFSDLQNEYDLNGETRYFVTPESKVFPENCHKAVFALEKIGDVTEPLLTEMGVFIFQYVEDAELDEEETAYIKEDMRSYLEEQAAQSAQSEAFEKWRTDYPYDINYKLLKITPPEQDAQ